MNDRSMETIYFSKFRSYYIDYHYFSFQSSSELFSIMYMLSY